MKVVYQNHHISYNPEILVPIRKNVHWECTRIRRYKGMTEMEKTAICHAVLSIPTIREEG